MNYFGLATVVVIACYILSVASTDVQRNVRNNFCNNTCNNNICGDHRERAVIPSNGSCTQYFVCVGGNPQPNTCPKGHWFNPEESRCDSSVNEKCNPAEEFKCPPTGIVFLPHDEYCDKYFMCFAGFPVLTSCADGLYFDRESLKCDYPEVAECMLEKCPLSTEPFEIVFLPSNVDCEKYYICYNGKAIEQYCAPGIHWNAVTNQCDFVENARCSYEEPEEPQQPLPHEIACGDGIYFEAHPKSCDHFFICSFGLSVMLECAPGFKFDDKNNWCNFPEHVECKTKSKTKTFHGHSSSVLTLEDIVYNRFL
ncbi:Peritrophin-1 [Pseudolycoriella hygida]|uniref:Peritrophin-1 n=1 Tax=Pseudolycoriella hygida TaxID=35572 RepID=A0A9Q0S6W2_9DIPT|nr:Peritrophin-1 [Pseudolycoriella hygida]